ncbi:UDP-N-acetylmuramoyl-L-alanyl-D-glutamate--2,6-diaminopimelate ligase [Salicibibacter halophilus]|uniref:UDP-N-acetylmuramoyl-L-alanyl-D-glutamate--2,6-diaminopimelate ligase n=1 Tax=Salicibibacter halophilus TaxID=2502791 RepID=A0A514LFI4_9BACI|nr:UDP-N-acetylmuramoyl-L-alanyl-D-glutamate--2,6-diaminopimelate ligase [Salicibibacter halophilus]QDI90604.1 UDP-N-acetylmuramoyl-L-alanyl-D-glutamate--2,6-diaminopimelate ligase [Salicibibacter halophilus]
MELHECLAGLLAYTKTKAENPFVTSVEMDSRLAQAGTLFVAIRGFTVDGHRYAQEAVEKGAVAVVAEEDVNVDVPTVIVTDTKRALAQIANRFYHSPTHSLNLIGVTGTNGKTTTTHLLNQILQDDERKTGLIGTLYTQYNDEVLEAKNTTPESLILQRTFSDMKEKGVTDVTMEVSSHALSLGRVRGTEFNIGVFTNLSIDHLDYHETMDDYKQAKGLLFSQLGNAYDKDLKVAVVNNDDPYARYMIDVSAAPVLTYGLQDGADVRARDLRARPTGTFFTLVVGDESIELNLKMIGRFSVYNALAAAAAAYVSGVSLSVIKQSLEAAKPIPGRFEPVEEEQEFAVIVDYAHTPDSLDNILQTVRELTEQNVYVIVGCGGDRDRTKRPEMAGIAAAYADEAIFTTDNPRSEDPRTILRDMEAGVEGQSFRTIEDRREAIRYAVHKAKSKDVIVIAGKGHEPYQEVDGTFHTFDDRVEAKEAIRDRREREK